SAMDPPLRAIRTASGGLRVFSPGPTITANKAAIFGIMTGENDDFVIGHSEVAKFSESRVDGFSDWFVSALFESKGKRLRASFGHGSPFVFASFDAGAPTLTFAAAPRVWSGASRDCVLGVSLQK